MTKLAELVTAAVLLIAAAFGGAIFAARRSHRRAEARRRRAIDQTNQRIDNARLPADLPAADVTERLRQLVRRNRR
jgi:hypothetical protein